MVSRPRSAVRLGHVAWGYTEGTGAEAVYTFGGVEDSKGLPFAPPRLMEFWQESQPAGLVGRLLATLAGLGYERFKSWPVERPDPERARAVAAERSRHSYLVVGNNCLDTVHLVLTAYGATDFHLGDRRRPQNWVPNAWYRSIPVDSRPLADISTMSPATAESASIRG
ncbi:MAG: hypothetical protein NVS9B1_15640 [Candidatus Dormibacteraceae bacterium]